MTALKLVKPEPEQVNDITIQGIPSHLVDHFWPFAEPYIKRALDQTVGEFKPEDFHTWCKNQEMQLWLICRKDRIIAALTTQIVNYPHRKHCRIATLGGSFGKDSDLLHKKMFETIDKWAKELGCISVEAYTRKGYSRRLLDFNFKHKCSVMIKDL